MRRPSRLWRTLRGVGKAKDDMCNRGEKMHCGSMSLVGWSDAANGGQSTDGKCRLGRVIGLMPSSSAGPSHVLRRTSKFNRKLVDSTLGGEVYALSEMVDPTSSWRDSYGPFEGLSPGIAGLEDCGSLFTNLKRIFFQRI